MKSLPTATSRQAGSTMGECATPAAADAIPSIGLFTVMTKRKSAPPYCSTYFFTNERVTRPPMLCAATAKRSTPCWFLSARTWRTNASLSMSNRMPLG